MLIRHDVLFLQALLAYDAGKKIKRDAFLYFDGGGRRFAQCGTCRDYKTADKKCAILGPTRDIEADDTCGAYVHGTYSGQEIRALVTPEEVGYLKKTQVRCENCKYGGEDCKLYVMLNETLPDIFDLDTKINSQGCCNAWIK